MLGSQCLFVISKGLMMNAAASRKTALNAIHRQLGARMIEFVGWDMPVQYAGPLPEHLAVRTRAGIFDVSHMGEIEFRGPAALESIQHMTCNDASRLAVGQIQYSAITTPQGTFVDDILVHRMGENHLFCCVNASNQVKDYEWFKAHARPNTDVIDRSHDFCQIAVQGPRAIEILRPLTAIQITAMRYYWFSQGEFAGVNAIVSRTGYTGEDGFEIYVDPRHAEAVWMRIMESGRPHEIQPAGLAARNTLRLEAKMALYGNDIDDTTTVLEADLAWICRFDKGDFNGRQPLLKQREEGVKRRLVGFDMVERGIARDHYPILLDGKPAGFVTSGSPAPFLQKNIGLTYLPSDRCAPGTEFDVVIRDKPVKARVVPTPFYKRPKTA